MRFIRVFLAICIFFLAVIFVVKNSEFLGQTTQFKLDLFVFDTVQKSIPLPLYFVILAAFLLGGLSAIVFLICDRVRLSVNLGKARRKIKHLERELNSLRTLPLASGGNTVLPEEKAATTPALPPFSDPPADADDDDSKPANPTTSS